MIFDEAYVLHVTDIRDWLVVPAVPIGPKHMLRDYPDIMPRCRIYWLQIESAMPCLKFRLLHTKHGLIHDDMSKLVGDLHIECGRDRSSMLNALIDYCVVGESDEYKSWFHDMVLQQDLSPPISPPIPLLLHLLFSSTHFISSLPFSVFLSLLLSFFLSLLFLSPILPLLPFPCLPVSCLHPPLVVLPLPYRGGRACGKPEPVDDRSLTHRMPRSTDRSCEWGEENKLDKKVSQLAEDCLEGMDPDDQNNFGEMKERLFPPLRPAWD